MDINGFREAQSPWFFTQPSEYLVETGVKTRIRQNRQEEPTPDNRFPGWAAPMADGRITTDYRSRCELNMPTGTQFASRRFMQNNAESIIATSRSRQATLAGAGMSFDSSSEMPAAQYVSCDTVQCSVTPGSDAGTGTERLEKTPQLFGTFATSSPSLGRPAAPKLTSVYEGGRNTPRGHI